MNLYRPQDLNIEKSRIQQLAQLLSNDEITELSTGRLAYFTSLVSKLKLELESINELFEITDSSYIPIQDYSSVRTIDKELSEDTKLPAKNSIVLTKISALERSLPAIYSRVNYLFNRFKILNVALLDSNPDNVKAIQDFKDTILNKLGSLSLIKNSNFRPDGDEE